MLSKSISFTSCILQSQLFLGSLITVNITNIDVCFVISNMFALSPPLAVYFLKEGML